MVLADEEGDHHATAALLQLCSLETLQAASWTVVLVPSSSCFKLTGV